MRGDIHADERNFTSNLMYKQNGKPVEAKLQLLDQSDKLMKNDVNFELSYPGNEVILRHVWTQSPTVYQKYQSLLTVQAVQGKQNRFDSTIERKDDIVRLTSDIYLFQEQPSRIFGEFGFTDSIAITKVELSKDRSTPNEKVYAAFAQASFDRENPQVRVGFENPDFSSSVDITSQMHDALTTASSELKWKNGKEDQQSIKGSLWFEPISANKLNGSITLSYPSRTFIFNAYHLLGSKYITHADFQWDSDKMITADTAVQFEGERLIATGNFKTPFIPTDVKVTLSHDSNIEEYHTKADLDWGERIFVDSVIKKPISIKTMVAVFDMSSTIKEIRKMNLLVNHKLSSSLASGAKFTWNKLYYQADVIVENTTKGENFGVTGSVDITTSHRALKKGRLEFSHQNNGNTFNLDVKLLRNKKEYKLDSTVLYNDKNENNGRIVISIPGNKYVTSWNHKHTDKAITSSVSSDQITVDFSARYGDQISTSMSIHMPLVNPNIFFEQNFVLTEDLLDSKVDVKVGEQSIAKVEAGYSRGCNFSSVLTIVIPDMNVNTLLKLDTYEAKPQYGLIVDARITPDTTVTLEMLQRFLQEGSLSHSSVAWKSSLPGYERFKYTYEIMDSDRNELKTTTTIEYDSDKVIQLKTSLLVDLHKKYEASTTLTTPFEVLPKFEGGISFEGDRGKFTSTGKLEIAPYIEQSRASVKWNVNNGIVCEMDLNLPGEQMLVAKVNIEEEFKKADSSFVAKNNLGQIYNIEAYYGYDEKTEGKMTISVPGRRPIDFSIIHQGSMSDFSTVVRITHNRKNSFVTNIRFSLNNAVSLSASSSLKTELISDSVDLYMSVQGHLKTFSIETSVTTSGFGKSSLYLTYDISRNVDARLTLKCPHGSFEISHNGNMHQCISSTELSYGKQMHRGDMRFDTMSDGAVTGSGNIVSTAIEPITFTFEAGGSLKKFKGNAVLTKASARSEANIEFGLSPSVFVIFDIKSPIISDISGSLSHTGTFPNTNTRVIISLPSQSDIDIEVGLANRERSTFLLNIKTPFNIFSKMDTEVTFEMNESVKIGASCELRTNDEKSTFDISVQGSPDNFMVQINSECPASPRLGLTVSNNKKPDGYKGTLKFKKEEDIYAFDFDYSLNDELNVNTKFEIPQIELSSTFDGTLRKLESETKYLFDGNSGSTLLKIDLEDIADIESILMIEIPGNGIIEGNFAQSFSSKHYQLKNKLTFDESIIHSVDISITADESIVVNGEVIIPSIEHSPVKLSATLTPTFISESQKLIFSGEMNIGSDKSVIELSYQKDSAMDTSLSIVSPYMSAVKGTVTADGNPENFNFQADLFLDGKRIGLITAFHGDIIADDNDRLKSAKRLTITLENDLEAIVDIMLKYDIEKRMIDFALSSVKPHPLKVSYVLQASLLDVKCGFEINHKSETMARGEILYKVVSRNPLSVIGHGKLATQSFESLISTTVDTAEQNYETTTHYKTTSKVWALNIIANTKDTIEAGFNMEIPDRDTVSGKVSYDNRRFKYISHADFSWNDTTKYEADLNIKYKTGVDVTVSVKTPLKNYALSEFKFTKKGSIPEIDLNGQVLFNNQIITGSVNVDPSNGVVTFTSPFERLKDIKLNYYRKGDLDNLDAGATLQYATGEEIRIEVDHNYNKPTRKASIVFVSPFTDEWSLKVEHSGALNDFITTCDLSMGDSIIASKVVSKISESSLSLTATLRTVASGVIFEQLAEIKHDGTLEQFKTEVLLQAQDKKIKLTASLDKDPVTAAALSLETPFTNMEDIKVMFSQSANSNSVQSSATVQYAKDKILSGNFNFVNNGMRHFTSDIELNTPFEGFEANRLSYTHTGDKNSIQCNTNINVMSKVFTGLLKASRNPMSMSFNVDTPFKGYESITLRGNVLTNSNGQYSVFVQTGRSASEVISFEGSFNLSPLEGSATITTPFELLKTGSVDFSMKDLAHNAEITFKARQNMKSIIDLTINHDLKGEHKGVLVTMRSPRAMLFSLDGDFTLDCVEFTTNINWNEEDVYSNLKFEGGYDMRYNEKTAKAKLSNPDLLWSFDGLISYKYKTYSQVNIAWGKGPTDRAGYDVSINTDNSRVKLILPSRSVIVTGSKRNQLTEGEFLWDADTDPEKKVTFRSIIIADKDGTNADVTITMPKVGTQTLFCETLLDITANIYY